MARYLMPVSELKSKRDRVVFLLDHWCDFYETLHQAESGSDESLDVVLLMPRMSRHPSVMELARAVKKARLVAPLSVAHTMAFYTAEWRTTDQMMKRRSKKGRVDVVKVRVRQRIVPKWIVGDRVIAGVLEIVDRFEGEVFIPSELLEAAA